MCHCRRSIIAIYSRSTTLEQSTWWRSVCHIASVRFVGGGAGGDLTPTGWRWPQHWWIKIFVWRGSASTLPVPIQQDQRNVQMISKYGTFHSNFEDRFIWLHDTDSDKKIGPDLLLKVLMFDMHEIWSLILPLLSLRQMFNVSALLLDDALKPATPMTNGTINETLRQFALLTWNFTE